MIIHYSLVNNGLFNDDVRSSEYVEFNPLNAELNPICNLLALLGAHHILHISRIRVMVGCSMNY